MGFDFNEMLSSAKGIADSDMGKSVAAMAGPYGMAAQAAISAAPSVAALVEKYTGRKPPTEKKLLAKAAVGDETVLKAARAILERSGASKEEMAAFSGKDLAVGARVLDKDPKTAALVARVQADPSAATLLGKAAISVLVNMILQVRRKELELCERRAMLEFVLARTRVKHFSLPSRSVS